MKRLTVAQAASEFGGICKETVRFWVEKDMLPPGYFGKCMKGKGRNTYYIWKTEEKEGED